MFKHSAPGDQRQAGRISRLGASLLVATSMLGSLLAVPATAQQQNEIILSVDFDGTAGFGDSADDGSGNGVHTPGSDGGANNNVVRTNDQLQYRIDWNVNESDATGATLRLTLPEGLTWLADPTTASGVPAGCAGGSITGNDGRDLECVTEAEAQGSNGAIHPRAQVGSLYDGDLISVAATIETSESAPVSSNTILTTVSAAPRGNWVKGDPQIDSSSGSIIGYHPNEEIFDVSKGGVDGRVFVYNLVLQPAGGLKGAEPMDDAPAIQFFDHFWNAPPSTVLADGLLPGGRSACGGYDGDGSFPYGTSGLGAADQTTAGTWTCSDISATAGTGYPVIQIDISGQNTADKPARNADGSNNASNLISGQIAFWVSEADLVDVGPPQIVTNAITGTTDAVTAAGPVDPIQVHGTSGPVDEASYDLDNNGNYEFPAGPPPTNPGRSMRHWVRYQNGPYREFLATGPNSAFVWRGMDRRTTTYGGTGYTVTDGVNGPNGGNYWRWDGDGQTPRGNTLVVVADFVTQTSNNFVGNDFTEELHACVVLDNTHQELIPMPSTFDVATVDTSAYSGIHNDLHQNYPTIGGTTSAPNSPLAQVLAGPAHNTTSNYWPGYQSSILDGYGTPAYELEFAAGTVDIHRDQHEVTCNQADADARGWVNGSGDLSVFDPNGDGRYEDITHVRIRGTEPVAWHSDVTRGNTSFGTAYQLSLQVRVKDDSSVGAQQAGQELMVWSSRASGSFDVDAGETQPSTASCTNSPAFTGSSNTTIPGGWCNLRFHDDGASSVDVDDFDNDFDAAAIELLDTAGRQRSAHADAVYIVEPALSITKSNTAGPSHIVVNGDIAEFEVRPAVIGSSLDEIHNVRFTDALNANYEFVGFTLDPSTPGATCTYTTTISCSFGNHPGGWSDVVRYQVRIVDAGANETIRNTAIIRGNDSNTGAAKPTASSSAYTYTPAPYEESGIIKAVDAGQGPCVRHPDGAAPADWESNCSLVEGDDTIAFDLTYANEGTATLDNYRLIDVFPHIGDDTEPASATGTIGDGRVDASDFDGDFFFTGATGTSETFWYTADDPSTISRDPGVADAATTWCDAASGGTVVSGPVAPCPAGLTEVTALRIDAGSLAPGATNTVRLDFQAIGHSCDDIYTNNFGARTDDLLLPIRSNDVSAMVGCADVSVAKQLVPGTGSLAVGETVSFELEVGNDGPDTATGVEATDHLPSWLTYTSDDSGLTPDVSGQDVTWTIPSIPVGGSTTITMVATVNSLPAPSISNHLEITDFDQVDTDSHPQDDDPVRVDTTGDGVPDTLVGTPTSDTNPPDEDDEASVPIAVQIGNRVWNDIDGDGVQDPAEIGVAGVDVHLLDAAGDPVLDMDGDPVVATTAPDGSYRFDVLPGVYVVEFDTDTLPDGTHLSSQDAAAATEATDSDADPSTGRTDTIDVTDPSALGDQNSDGVPDDMAWDAGIRPGSSIAGTVTDDLGDPIEGVAITLTGTDDLGNPVDITVETDENGDYEFTDLRPGTYTVTEAQPDGYTDGPDSIGSEGGDDATNDEFSAIVLGPNTAAVDYDFTETTASIAGTVVDDLGNPIEGVELALTGTDVNGDPVSATTTTDENGDYHFDGLVAGDYTVTETQPAGYGDGIDTAGSEGGDATTTNDVIADIPLGAGVDSVDNDFAETTSSIAGTVFEDRDNNGTDEIGDDGIEGVLITLSGTDVNGDPVSATTTTDENGDYHFDGLLAGEYTVTETQPAGYEDGIDTAGSEGGDATTTNDVIADIPLGAGVDSVDNDFAEIGLSSIAGTVFVDDDNDGIQQAETGIAGVEITLTGTDDLGNPVDTTVETDENGDYQFTNLRPGTYTVTETQPADHLDGIDTAGSEGGDASSADDVIASIDLPPFTDATGYDFGEIEPAGVAGSVTDDLGSPIAGVEITLTGTDDLGNPVDTTVETDENGDYEFTNLRPGTYTVTEAQPDGYADGPESAGSSGGDIDVDDVISAIVVAPGDDAVDYDFVETTSTLAGTVFHDRDENGTQDGDDPGIAGVTLTLIGTDSSGEPVSATTSTDADGNYSFEGLLAGEYTITETQPIEYEDGTDTAGSEGGDASVDDVISGIVLGAGVDGVDNDFAEVGNVVTGTVWFDRDGDATLDPDEITGLGGVTLTMTDPDGNVVATAVTNDDGTYAFPSVPAGDYTVTQTQPDGYRSSTTDVIDINVPVGGLGDVDFGEEPASIAGTVWNDDDESGSETGAESPVAGVTVTLTGTTETGETVERTTTTDTDGNYRFDDLAAGDYDVTLTPPAGSALTQPNAGNDDTIDSDFEYLTQSVGVTLSPGEQVSDIDAGLVDAEPDLSVDIRTDSVSPAVGDGVTFTVTSTNSGNTPVQGGIETVVTLTDQVRIDGVVAPDGWTITTDGNTVTGVWDGPLLPGESPPPFEIETTVVRAGPITATATISSVDGTIETTMTNNRDVVVLAATNRTTTDYVLAFTGSSSSLMVGTALTLMAAGTALMAASRRRRSTAA